MPNQRISRNQGGRWGTDRAGDDLRLKGRYPGNDEGLLSGDLRPAATTGHDGQGHYLLNENLEAASYYSPKNHLQ